MVVVVVVQASHLLLWLRSHGILCLTVLCVSFQFFFSSLSCVLLFFFFVYTLYLRKVIHYASPINAVLYHQLVRQFLSQLAFGLDHPPVPQKRIPDTVKRVVTK